MDKYHLRKEKKPMGERARKIVAILCIFIFFVFCAAVIWYLGRPMLQLASKPEEFRAWVDSYGYWGRLLFIGMVFLQISVAFIPGEPLEIAAGYTFGIWEGTLLCMIATTLASIVIFVLVRRFGVKLVEVFFPIEKIQSMKFLRDTQKLNILIFLLIMIPGSPKDFVTYFVGLTKMKLSTWIYIVVIARIPSIITSTIGGDALGVKNYQFAILVFVITVVISGAGAYIYKKICDKHSKEKE